MTAKASIFTTPWFHGWNIVAVALFVQIFAVGLSTSVFGVYITPIGLELDASRFATGMAYALLFAGLGLTSPLAGRLLERGSIRMLMTTGFVILATGLLLLSFATHINQVLAIYGVLIALGATLAGAIPASTLVTNWFYSCRGRALGISTIGASAGGLVMPPLAAVLMEYGGWRYSFQVFSVLTLVATIPLVLWAVSNRPEDMGLFPDGVDQPAVETRTNTVTGAAVISMAGIVASRGFWAIALCMGLANCVTAAVMVNITPHAIDLGHRQTHAASLISVFTVGLILGKVFIGAASDHFSTRILWQCCLGVVAIGVILLMFSVGLAALGLASFLAGLGSGGYYPLMGMSIARNFPIASFSKVMGMVLPVMYLLSAPAAPLAGLVFDLTGSYSRAMSAAIGLLGVASLVMFFLGKPKAPSIP